MSLIGKLSGLLGQAFVYTCVAVVAAQGVGAAKLVADGAFTRDKITKYAAIVYGFDVTELQTGTKAKNTDGDDNSPPREEEIQSRADAEPSLKLRHEAIGRGADDIRGVARQLSTWRERDTIVKQGFADLLDKLEQDTTTASLQEVRQTLEVLQPKQAKNLLMTMLGRDDPHDDDDVLQDLLGIISDMPGDKLKKVFGEFKTPQEQAVLHTLLVEIGELDKR